MKKPCRPATPLAMNWRVPMPKLPQSLATLTNQAATALRQAAAWIEHHRLKIKHAKTLERFNNLHYTDGV